MNYFRSRYRLAPGLAGRCLALAVLLLSGCPGQPSSGSLNRGEELLKKMQSAYQRAHSYSDAAELKVDVAVDGQVVQSDSFPFSVAFEKANRLRVGAFDIRRQYDVSVVCDGEHLWAAVGDQRLEGQILFLPAPTEITMKGLYQESMLEKTLGGDESGLRLPQLELLLANEPLEHLFGEDMTTQWRGEKTLPGDDSLCHVCEVTGSRGTFVLWVDPNSHLLRRFEITDPKFLNLSLEPNQKLLFSIDFTGGAFDREIDAKAFKFEPPKTARLVSHFVVPPAAPDEQIGQQVGDLKFIDLDGKPFELASLKGRVVVLDIWALSCEWCFKSFPNLEKVYQQYRDNDKVAILTVNNDRASDSDASIRAAFTKAKLDLPIIRDPEGLSQSVLKIPAWPAMVILGPDGRVQIFDLGYKRDLAESLPRKIDELLAGKDLAEETLSKYRREVTQFQQQLAEATVGVNQQIEVERAKIAEATEPKHLKLEKLWTTSDVKDPGNFRTYDDFDGKPTIALLDGWHTICQIDGEGKTIARHELDLPQGEAVTLLRTAVDSIGRRYFAAFGVAQRKMYLLDDGWKIVARYPEETRQGISDVQFADLDGDGQLEAVVGYLGEVGVQAASLAGQRIWSNRAFENVFSLAVLPRDVDGHQRTLVGSERQAIGVLDHNGTQLADIPVPNRPIDVIVAAEKDRLSPLAWDLAALSATRPEQLVALGLDMHFQVQWEYPLPAGVRNTPCEVLTAGQLQPDGSNVWLLTGPDGSIHLLAADGQVIDTFFYGQELTGIGTMQLNDQSLLLVATAKELTAWKVTVGQSATDETPADEPALTTADRPDRPSLGDAPSLDTDTDEKPTAPAEESEEKPAETDDE